MTDANALLALNLKNTLSFETNVRKQGKVASVKLGRFTKDIILHTSKPLPVAKYLRQELSHI